MHRHVFSNRPVPKLRRRSNHTQRSDSWQNTLAAASGRNATLAAIEFPRIIIHNRNRMLFHRSFRFLKLEQTNHGPDFQ